ncbi:MAG: Glu-tRNA(Gln) amidotransferase subunit GatD [Methanomassiliicoccaceae archaeon]|jgi:glutamyl-tRNA(Gln) amidotransferase subunit D|nr:Glu-tRNA(Gln) amidotransferase subunit GatD [Methanomassiliicoccaceae archaeon]
MRYSGELSKMLGSAGAKEGSVISLTADGKEYEGVLMPSSGNPDVIVIKMRNGYNAGFRTDKGTKIKVLEQPSASVRKNGDRRPKKGLPNITLIATGGTIGSHGGTSSGASAERLLDMMPELSDIANIKAVDAASVFSENMDAGHWQAIAKAAEEELNGGAEGIVITHGTDTMGFTAAALSFMMRELSGPVVITGSQRSPDRPSSDAYGNLLASVRFCVSPKASGVCVVMHDTMNDDSFAVHRGTRARKMHTSRRDAFKSVNTVPIAHIDAVGNMIFNDEMPKRSKVTRAETKMCGDVVLLHFYPGMGPALFRDAVLGSKGVVIAGSGLGHVSDAMAALLKEAADKGTVIVMTSQCINGPTGMDVYDTGRELQRIGVIPAGDMLPETAYVKLMWALANTKDAKGTMKKALSYETGDRRTTDVVW